MTSNHSERTRYWNDSEDKCPCAGELSVINAIFLYAIAWPDKPGADPMVPGYINKWTPSRKAGQIPQVSTRFSLIVDNEQADA